jgi:type II secretory pathway pseudopilin PulG
MNDAIQSSGDNIRRLRLKRSFTLVELLVVVAVILILFGISLRIMSLVNRKAGVARTTWILEQVKNALGAYYTSYGTYPPGDRAANGYTSVDYVIINQFPSAGDYSTCTNWGLSTGLVFYLKYVSDAPRWDHYITFVPNGGGGAVITNATYSGGFVPPFTNTVQSIVDAWGTKLIYVSSGTDGYQNFKLWSCGPNGTDNSGGGDDLGVTSGE